MLALKVLIFVILVPGTVAGWVPYWLSRWPTGLPALELGAWRHIGWLLLVPGIAVLLWSVWEFASEGQGTPAPIDPPKRFVATGMYRYVRNPMYVGVLSAVVGQALLYESWNVLIYAAILWGVVHAFVVFYEEPTLRRLFGDQYAAYCGSVPRWIPRRPANRP
ncbi:MAG: isoprenylcysteine carboxylmethyltransferase family protein [Pirellulales bacterium]